MKKLVTAVVLAAFVVAGCGNDSGGSSSSDSEPTASTTPTPTPTDPQVDISGEFDVGGGRHLHLQCTGLDQDPTIVIDVGGDDTITGSWGAVYSPMGEIGRVCAYDRANLGVSDADPGPRTTTDLAEDLLTLLHVAKIPGPYVFVGGSFGGNIVGILAANHPKEVAGLVFVDSDPANVDPALDPFRTNMPAKDYKECCDITGSAPAFDDPVNVEHIDWEGGLAAELASVHRLPKVPTVVLTATRLECEPDWDCEAILKADARLQREWIKGNPKGSQIFADSGHVMQREAPQAIIDATATVLEQLAS